eukprot:m.8372 g.8372  ORF g.8372 m.8372 type:complete len:254 (-) comp6086_c0_seq1:93-854(-)
MKVCLDCLDYNYCGKSKSKAQLALTCAVLILLIPQLDYFIQHRPLCPFSSIVYAACDSFTHATVGVLIWSCTFSLKEGVQCIVQLVRHFTFQRALLELTQQAPLLSLLVCFFSSTLIDIDHFVNAHSFHLKDAIGPSTSRPPLHSMTNVLLLVTCIYLVLSLLALLPAAPKSRHTLARRITMAVATGLISHLVRDSWRRGLLFTAIAGDDVLVVPVTYPLYLFTLCVFCVVLHCTLFPIPFNMNNSKVKSLPQ